MQLTIDVNSIDQHKLNALIDYITTNKISAHYIDDSNDESITPFDEFGKLDEIRNKQMLVRKFSKFVDFETPYIPIVVPVDGIKKCCGY
jgi:hypothetical protein